MKPIPTIYDRDYVRNQYAQDANLRLRIETHRRFSQPQMDLVAWVLDHLPWTGREVVLDVGCGYGSWAHETLARCGRYVAADLSLGMLRALELPGVQRVNLDVQRLPFANQTADIILANHMLYHVPDRHRALAEIVRVLNSGGRLVAATNSRHNMAELFQLERQALALTWRGEGQGSWAEGFVGYDVSAFNLENGASMLASHFTKVERHDLPGTLAFPEPKPVIDYIGSSRDRLLGLAPEGVTWADLAGILEDLLAAHYLEHEYFQVDKLTGVFICHQEA
jgi:SAM-dependent methyltransferase